MLISHAFFVETYTRLTAACIAGLWQGTVLALIAAVLLKATPKASPGLRHTLLVIAFAIAAVLPWLHFGSVQTVTGGHTLRLEPGIAAAIAAIWLMFAIARATNLALAWRRLRAVHQNATPLVLAGQDGFSAGTRHALLCSSADVDSPTILGFRQPRLLLPEWMVPQLSGSDLQQIALHECEHLRRHDDWLNLLLQIMLVLSPLNPALIWLDRRISVHRELACDAAVVASTAQPIAYATCLTRLAEQRIDRNRLTLALAAWGRKSELGQRVEALLTQSSHWSRRQSQFAATATATALLAGAFALAHTPLAVRITSSSAAPSNLASASFPQASTVAEALPYGVRAVPAAFYFKPTTQPVRNAKIRQHAVPVNKALLNQPKAVVARPEQTLYHQTAADWRRMHRDGLNAEPGFDHATIRFVTTEFSSPYVAVPTVNGWLVFQL